jgi:hypothetical protein
MQQLTELTRLVQFLLVLKVLVRHAITIKYLDRLILIHS